MSLSVLIVEDEFIIAEDMRAALVKYGYHIFGIAYSYERAITLLEKGRPDIVLVDITLDHQQTGLSLGRQLYEKFRIPYIYVTSHADPGTMRDVERTNPSGYLTKPFSRESLGRMIEIICAMA